MSYDIFAFDVQSAPADDASLLTWYREQAKWGEPHSYDDASVTTPALRAFYREMITIYPPMNGPDAPEFDDDIEFDEDIEVADYCIGYSIVYVAFGWSEATLARDAFVRLGAKHQVGVCEISEDPLVIHRHVQPRR
jgi:hypothetical protein